MEVKERTPMTYREYKKQTNYEPRIAEIVDLEDLRKLNRKQHLVHKRYFLMNFLRENTRMSLTDIGILFERHHASVIYGLKAHANLIETKDETYRDNVRGVKTFLELKF
tara:strand:- start:1662 stop:1988 length:327 start_codon:yes stop_codon:yes gene_type:complete